MDGYVLTYSLGVVKIKSPKDTLSITARKWHDGEITPAWVRNQLGEEFVELVTALFAYTDVMLTVKLVQFIPTGKMTTLRLMMSHKGIGQGQSAKPLNGHVQKFVSAQAETKNESEAEAAA